MNTMRFSEKQEKVNIYELENGARDAVILTNEREVTETESLEDGKEKETTAYEYDGNIFRTHSLTAEQIKANPESYLDYEEMKLLQTQWLSMQTLKLTSTQHS